MVCSFCSQGLSRKFEGEPAVETFKVNLEDKVVRLKLKQGQSLSDEKVTSLITDSGFNVDRIERKDP